MSNKNCEFNCNKKTCKKWECGCCSIWDSCASKPRYRNKNDKKGGYKILYCSDCENDDYRFKDVKCSFCNEVKSCMADIKYGSEKYSDKMWVSEVIIGCMSCFKINELEGKNKELEDRIQELEEMLKNK